MSDLPISSPIRPLPTNLPAEHTGRGAGSLLSFEEPAHSEVQLREFIKLAIKYRTVIFTVTAICTVLSLIYAFTVTPRYTTASMVRISVYAPVLTSTKIEDLLHENSRELTYLDTQLQELKSYSLADKVLEDQEIRNSLILPKANGFWGRLLSGASNEPNFTSSDGQSIYQSPVSLIRQYLDLVDIRPVRRTSLVAISVTSEDPVLAAKVANRHATAYIDWVRQVRVEQQARGLTFLRSQADELREKVADLERELADYAEANSIVALNKDENITAQKMSQLNKMLTDATAKRIEAENTYNQAQVALKNPSAGFDDASAQQMRSDLGRLEGELQQLSAKFTDQYPRVQQLKSQIEGLKKALEGGRKQIVLGLQAKMLAAQEEEKNLKEELEQQKSLAFELAKRQVQYNVVNRDLASSREMLENVLRQIKETSLAVESNSSNVSVVDFAVPPTLPSFPRKNLLVGVGLLFGLLSGVGLAILLNYMDNTVRTPEDLTNLLKIPSLGVVPSFELEDHSGVSKNGEAEADTGGFGESETSRSPDSSLPTPVETLAPIAFLSDPRSLAAEAYRTIRTGLLLSQAGEPPRTLLLTSAQTSEGKTTSSINLAASLASAGGRVVLVDADLRRPSVHRHFKMQNHSPGLVEVITGNASIEEVILPDVVRRVSILPSGSIPPNPAELLGSLEMASVVDELAQRYDYVIIDSPPILPVTDSVILSRYVDGVILVVRGASTPRKVIKDAKDRLRAVGARFLGAILNDVDITSGDYYYYHRYYHSYYHEDRDDRGRGAPRRRRSNQESVNS